MHERSAKPVQSILKLFDKVADHFDGMVIYLRHCSGQIERRYFDCKRYYFSVNILMGGHTNYLL
jgi:hypothetical protein